MFQHFKFYIILSLLMGLLLTIRADTKVLSSLNLFNGGAIRNEIIHLDNDQHLVIEGSYTENYYIPNDPNNKLSVIVVYVADKNGNRVKYVFVKRPLVYHLNPSTLKSSAG